MIKGKNANHPIHALERHRQGGTQRGGLRGISKVAHLDRGIPVENRLSVRRYPTGNTFPERNLQRGEEPVIFTTHVLRNQPTVLFHVDGNRIVRNQPLDPRRQHGKSVVQAEGVCELLAQLIQSVHFLPGGGDGSQEVYRAILGGVRVWPVDFEPCSGGKTLVDLHIDREQLLCAVPQL